MKSKKLLLFNAWSGILLGLYIADSPRWRWRMDFTDLNPRLIEDSNGAFVILAGLFLIILSIIGMAYYNEDERVDKLSHQFLFWAGLASVIPFLARLGGGLAIAAGVLYLLSLKKFPNQADKKERGLSQLSFLKRLPAPRGKNMIK